MQRLNISLIDEAKKTTTKNLEKEMREIISPCSKGEIIVCPYCKYESKKNPKGSAKIFENDNGKFFKCFACGKWRRI